MAANSLTVKYNNKKRNAKDRGIAFDLSLIEYRSLMDNSQYCDYTGRVFTTKGDHTKSLERIDDTKGYNINNCCVVTRRVNTLKDTYFDKLKGSHKISPEDMELLLKVKLTLDTRTSKQLTEKYREGVKKYTVDVDSQGVTHIHHESRNKNNTQEKKDMTISLKEVEAQKDITTNDIKIAEAYLKFSKKKEEFNVSINAFKKAYNKKKCAVTGKKFEDIPEGGFKGANFCHQAIVRIDRDLPWEDSNIQPVCALVSNIMVNGIFNKKELLKLSESV